MIKVTILGNNSAIPAYDRNPTSQIVEIKDQLFLMDCGEGTQMRMKQYQIKRRRINYIFISHLHGDHYFGLVGLINSMGLLNRTADLHIFGPPLLKNIIDLQLSAANTILPYKIIFTAIEASERKILVDHPDYQVSCFPVEHRIPCHGFLFIKKEGYRKIIPEKCLEFQVPTSYFYQLKKGNDFLREDGVLIKNEWLTTSGKPEKRYAFTADTRFTDSFLPDIQNVDLLYHESTYLKDYTEKAFDRYHSTSEQAALIALKSGSKKLLLGHYSAKYKDLDPF